MEPEAEAVEMIPESLASLSYGTTYYVYFDQAPPLGKMLPAGGTINYVPTPNQETAMSGTNRFFIGSIITPMAGGAATIGFNDGGAGAQVAPPMIPPSQNTSSLIHTAITTATSVMQQSITIPSSGGPYQILTNYDLYLDSTFSKNGYDTWCTDGTNDWAFDGFTAIAGQNGVTLTASATDTSPSYPGGTGTVTVTVMCECNQHSAGSSLTAVTSALSGPGVSLLKLTVIEAIQ